MVKAVFVTNACRFVPFPLVKPTYSMLFVYEVVACVGVKQASLSTSFSGRSREMGQGRKKGILSDNRHALFKVAVGV